ncbi:MAG TPA: sigma-54 dependent transcriptional regulator, partial [Bacteroidaceae bacterium]|nr:sigma-54 dependent transcriptional regulator [Bacteroidaceae bacterium]
MILIIDDDKAIRSSLNFMLSRTGYEVATAATPGEAVLIAQEQCPELILMDMNYSLSTTGEEGLRLLQEMKTIHPQTPVILITAWGSIDIAVQGMKLGAFDFITKPWDNRQLMQQIETALELSSSPTVQSTNNPTPQKTDISPFDRSFIIGQSQAITDVLKIIERVAKTNASVLITGESGTGKELIAEAIHRNSQRAQNAFVKVNLGGISQSLFESEMFGHKKGAFTDASSDRIGRFTLADKGTIFLDEIGELDLSCQVKLLRVLQDQTYEVLGDSKQRKIDVRVVCATNEDLPTMIKQKTFREDLFYRINLIQVHLPALRERREDIPLLIKHSAQRQQEEHNRPKVTFTEEAMTRL